MILSLTTAAGETPGSMSDAQNTRFSFTLTDRRFYSVPDRDIAQATRSTSRRRDLPGNQPFCSGRVKRFPTRSGAPVSVGRCHAVAGVLTAQALMSDETTVIGQPAGGVE